MQDLVETSNDVFKNLERKGTITEKELRYFTVNHKKVTNLGKMYLLLKVHKKPHCFFGRPVISNCGTPTDKISEFLNNEDKTYHERTFVLH